MSEGPAHGTYTLPTVRTRTLGVTRRAFEPVGLATYSLLIDVERACFVCTQLPQRAGCITNETDAYSSSLHRHYHGLRRTQREMNTARSHINDHPMSPTQRTSVYIYVFTHTYIYYISIHISMYPWPVYVSKMNKPSCRISSS